MISATFVPCGAWRLLLGEGVHTLQHGPPGLWAYFLAHRYYARNHPAILVTSITWPSRTSSRTSLRCSFNSRTPSLLIVVSSPTQSGHKGRLQSCQYYGDRVE